MHLSAKLLGLGTESAFHVLAHARRLEAMGRDIIHLELGEPDFPTPSHIVEAGVSALRDGATKYAPAAGLPPLREAIAANARRRGLSVTPDRVIVASGAKPVLFYALVGLLEPGAEALVPDPGFPIYASVVQFAGARPVPYPVEPEQGGTLDLERLASLVTPRTRVLVLNTPHNPTGIILDAVTLAGLVELVQRHNLTVISDEIYSELTFDDALPSIAALPGMLPRTVVVDGFSKTYAMTGWRLGYGIMPPELARRIERLIINTTSCAPPFVQRAGIAALTGPQDCVRVMRDEYRRRRDLLVGGLNALTGISCSVPQGAFYAFPNVSQLLTALGLTTEIFAEVLLEEYGLACLAGTAFGERGRGHLRFSFVTSLPVLERALATLQDASPAAWRAPVPERISVAPVSDDDGA
ncbi:MAG TPA: pyridoxal phosphate-dependent aminotransferase [Gemmatimonadales bacterium]|nr:pyridoxal phosphate-dependent aminotransferase [Gemmatimonadales bacterium]